MLRIMLTFVVSALLALPAAQGAIVITVSDATVVAGQNAFVDVFVRTNAGDLVGNVFFDISITPVTGTGLEFLATDTQYGEANYLFAGNSAGETGGVPTSFLGGVPPNSNIQGADIAVLDVSPATNRLLARLEITTTGVLPPNVGDAFDISFNVNPGNLDTFFFDSTFATPVDVDLAASDLTGRVDVIAAVPEPSSLVLCSLMGVGLLRHRRRWA